MDLLLFPGGGLFLSASACEDVGQRVVTLVTRILEDQDPVGLAPHWLRYRKGSRKCLRIIDRELVVDRIRVDGRVPLDQVQCITRSSEVRPGVEIRGLYDPRIAVPMAAGVAHPLRAGRSKILPPLQRV